MSTAVSKGPAAFPKYDPRRARVRLVISIGVAALAMMALQGFSWPVRAVAGWNGLALTQLAVTWWIISTSDAAETGRRAGSYDPGRVAVGLVVVLSSVVRLFAAMILLRRAAHVPPEESHALVLLCLTSVVGSWFLTHTTFTLRYARQYYGEDEVGGLQFPGERPPDDWDFAYFAFTVGMCFQVSDVVICEPKIRRTALFHALISFAYNTAILALALNLVFGLV
jgi:uncharacterized membrane protein